MRCLRTISAYSLEKERSTGFLIRPADEAALPVVCLGRALGELFRTLCRTSHFLLTHLVEWVDGGLIQVVANCAVLLRHYPDSVRELFPPDFDPWTICSSIPRMFLTFAMYPPILRSMVSAINESVLTQEQIEALSWALERDQGQLEIHGVEEDWMAKVIDYLSRCSDEVRESQRAEIRPGQKQPRGGNLCDCDMVSSRIYVSASVFTSTA
ncbi:hypothetical protein BKA70DRAFT_593321 [Coprinopsis sp. MPI-PUGE-AT-0042]|nr:hypothetical protein BKA70DRAFT_593321 [Coprinopsis sp. MPI-PUGE-AT-0042]